MNKLELPETEARIASYMLRQAAEHYGNHGCNDFEIPNVPHNLAFVKRMIAASAYPDDEPIISADGKLIHTLDWRVMQYCAQMLEVYTASLEATCLTT